MVLGLNMVRTGDADALVSCGSTGAMLVGGQVLAGRITEESQIEHILDGILNFGDDLRFLDLSKKLCRHIYYQYPQLVGNFVSMYRALFVEGGNDDGGDNNHDQSSQRCL